MGFIALILFPWVLAHWCRELSEPKKREPTEAEIAAAWEDVRKWQARRERVLAHWLEHGRAPPPPED